MPINATVFGRLGDDPETRDAAGSTVCSLRVASSDGYGDRRTTTWLNINIWGKRGEWVAENMKKGERVLVTGQLHERKWGEEANQRALELRADTVTRIDWPEEKPAAAPGPAKKAPKKKADHIDPNDPESLPF